MILPLSLPPGLFLNSAISVSAKTCAGSQLQGWSNMSKDKHRVHLVASKSNLYVAKLFVLSDSRR